MCGRNSYGKVTLLAMGFEDVIICLLDGFFAPGGSHLIDRVSVQKV